MNSKEKRNGNRKKNNQKAFEELKDKIISQLILVLLKREGKFRVETDVSGHTIEKVLSHKQKGKWKSIAFLSRTIQPAERNYLQ